jgi:hypothetical protein
LLPHRSYVLRCLPVRTGARDEVVWRFSIQEAEPDARRHAFVTIEELAAFLRSDLAPRRAEDDPAAAARNASTHLNGPGAGPPDEDISRPP